jgi:putative methylase
LPKTQIRRKRLEIALQKLRPLEERSARLEQYQTPAAIAADVLWEAFAAGDIHGRAVVDLGCGNGVFCIGAKLMGAELAMGVDVDPGAVTVARSNAEMLGLDLEISQGDVSSISGSFDTVLMNPPFGAQTRHADRAFIEKAVALAPVSYSLHNDGSQEFIGSMVGTLGGRSEAMKRYKFEIPYAFEFHRKANETISVVLLKLER